MIIPALNELDGIGETIRRIPLSEMEYSGFEVEVIVVDGGSHDGTAELAAKKGAIVLREERPGYGRAYKTGFSRASGEVIVTTDADGSYPVEIIPKLLSLIIRDGYDFVTTNRFHKLQNGSMDLINRLGNTILSLTLKVLFSIPVVDSQSGMWAIRRTLAVSLPIKSDGMAFSEELKVRAFKLCRAVEVPIQYRRRLGQKKLRVTQDGLSDLLHLIRLRLTQ